jgi:hydroxymethylglutaryl-CoA lyase
MRELVRIIEVGARDGLQNIATFVPTPQKIALIDLLSACGFSEIEAASFVSPKWVPQMADGAQVMAGITRAPGTRYTALTPNARGFSEALNADVDAVAIFVSASEGFSKANINSGIDESLQRLMPVVENAFAANMRVRGYISCVTDCPFDGPVAPEAVARVAEALSGMGCAEISLGDTIGQGTPTTIAAMLDAVLAVVPAARLAGHFHATNGRALDNTDIALSRGLRVFDSAIGGLGGCPYAPGAQGNLATEALHTHLETLGYETGLDPVALAQASRFAQRLKGNA